MRVVVAFALCLPLAGCFSLTGPKPLPEWAMSSQAESEAPRAAPRRSTAHRAPRVVRAAERTGSIAEGPTVTQPAGLPRDGVHAEPARPPSSSPTAFSAEWQAREAAADERLRRSMNICRGC